MKHITATLYEIEPGLYAEQRGPKWWITDEQEHVKAGPFDTLEALGAAHSGGPLEIDGAIETPDLDPVDLSGHPEDLVTLREAAQFLPVTRQNLEYHRNRGSLKVSPVVTGRTVELYSLEQLKEAFPS